MTLPGHFKSGGKTYKRRLNIRWGGQFRRGLILVEMSGSAAGGLKPIKMHVSIHELAEWILNVLNWLRNEKRERWHPIPEEAMREARELLKEVSTKSE